MRLVTLNFKEYVSLVLFTLVVLISGCGKTSLKYNSMGVGNSILESKERGTFIFEYDFNLNIHESVSVDIESVWVERVWKYDYPFDKTKIGNGYHIVIKMKDSNWRTEYRNGWYLGVDYEFNFTPSGKQNLVSNHFSQEPLNYLIIELQKEDNLAEHQSKKLIGRLILKKK